MFFDIVASGSKGNAAFFKFNNALILLDMGISQKKLNEELSRFDFSFENIDAIFFTHDHSDHISGLKYLKQNKCYALKGTLPSSLGNVLIVNKSIFIKDIKVTPFMIYHDAKNPCGYVFEGDGLKIVYVTDTGKLDDETISLLKNPDYLIIESNHDIKMLLLTPRSAQLKNRILSEYGHLCNEDSAFLASKIIGSKTKQIVLAHLSLEANSEEVALKAYKKVFTYLGLNFNSYNISCAKQFEPLIGGDYDKN